MQIHSRTSRWTALAAVLCAWAGGCADHAQTAAPLKLPPPKPQRVDFANLSAHTSAVDAAASVNADELLARATALLKNENAAPRIQRLVVRFPDAALEVLRNTSAAQAGLPENAAVAMAYDRAFTAVGAQGWTKALMDAAVLPQEYETMHQARLRALQLIESGHPEKVLTEIPVPAHSAFPLAEADFLRLRGIAALLCDRTPDALRDWSSAGNLARADHVVCAELFLLEAAALRHDGTPADAEVRWSQAASAAVSIHDPGLWQRLLEARGEPTQWPPAVTTSFDTSSAAASGINNPQFSAHVEGCIWRKIGEWRFARGETPAALLAFKQAEALFVLPGEQAEARISEARALLTMNQSGAAVSILTSLAADSDPQVSHHAMAVLGNARIALDDIQGALTLLQSAVTNDDSFPPSLRAPARADLGLVYLMSSREKDGLDWLHRAQADFQAGHDNAGLVQCLQNEAAYLERLNRTKEAGDIRQRISRISAAF